MKKFVSDDGKIVAVDGKAIHSTSKGGKAHCFDAEERSARIFWIDRKYFNVIEKSNLSEKLKDSNLIIVGSIPPEDAKKIGEILNVRYLIYGNVADVSLAEDNEAVVTVNTVKARIIARIIDVQTGKILMATKGEGQSERALINLDGEASVTIGTKKVSTKF